MTIEEAIEIQKWLGNNHFLFAKTFEDVKASTDMAVKNFESLQTVSNLFSKWQNGEVDDNEYFFQMQNILLFGKMLEGEVSE